MEIFNCMPSIYLINSNLLKIIRLYEIVLFNDLFIISLISINFNQKNTSVVKMD